MLILCLARWLAGSLDACVCGFDGGRVRLAGTRRVLEEGTDALFYTNDVRCPVVYSTVYSKYSTVHPV